MRKTIQIIRIHRSSLVFLCNFNPRAYNSFLILWGQIRNLNNLWLFSKSTSIFVSVPDRSLNLLLRNLLNKLGNLRFDNNTGKSSLNIRICVRWPESFVNSKLWLLKNILRLLRWIRFEIDSLSLDISWRCDWGKTLRLSLI